jgi:16S rRNA U516 pseudouridylate synthase RsuA-like enzyme
MQVRRMFTHVSTEVIKLHRMKVGVAAGQESWQLGQHTATDLIPGACMASYWRRRVARVLLPSLLALLATH